MSIRADLQQVLHVAPPLEMQHATSLPTTATSNATPSATTYGKASDGMEIRATHHAIIAQQPVETDANDSATLAADYEELTACIIELCQLAGYLDDARERMLSARRNLYPFQYATECAYFRLQVVRAKAGMYWHNDALNAGI